MANQLSDFDFDDIGMFATIKLPRMPIFIGKFPKITHSGEAYM
jgi:hypothetical protein